MSTTPEHAEYRCEDGHTFHGLDKLEVAPESLPCPHVSEGGQDACRKMAKRFYGRND